MRWQYIAIIVPAHKHRKLLFKNNKNLSLSLYSSLSHSLFFNIFRLQSLSFCTFSISLHCSSQVSVFVITIKSSSVFVAFQFSNNLVSDIFSAAVENCIFAFIRSFFIVHCCLHHSQYSNNRCQTNSLET